MSKEFKTHDLEAVPRTTYYKCVVCEMYIAAVRVDGGREWMQWTSDESPYIREIVSCNEYLMQKALM